MNVRFSRFNSDIVCIEASEDSPKEILDRLDSHGLGFAVLGSGVDQPLIVIDTRGNLTEDELLAVEAHEVGHVVSGSADEPTAELHAIAILRLAGHHAAADLLLNRGFC